MNSADIHMVLDAQTFGGEGVPVPSVPGPWCQIAAAVPSAGGAVRRLIATVNIYYDTGYAIRAVTCGGKSGLMKSSSGPRCPLS